MLILFDMNQDKLKKLKKMFDFFILSVYNKYRKWQSTNVVLPDILRKLTSTLQSYRCELFYLCSCLSTQFLYRTAVKATFNVKDNINDIIKNSTTLTINITTSPTKIRKVWWQNHICLLSLPTLINITHIWK